MDLLFASNSPFTWDEEAHFKKLKEGLAAGGKMQDIAQGEGLERTPSVESHRNDTSEKS